MIGAKGGEQIIESEESLEYITGVSFSPSALIASVDAEGLVVLRSARNLLPSGAIVEMRGGSCIALSPKGNYLATGGFNGVVYLYQCSRALERKANTKTRCQSTLMSNK